MSGLKLAVLGSPIAHSRTPQLQASFALDAGISGFSCERIETTRETLHDTIRRLVADGYDGFNCTMPLKTDMASYAIAYDATKISEEAKILRSVNTVAIRNGGLIADTTDGGGIILTIRRALGRDADMRNMRVALLGAGGSARSAALSVSLAGAELTILNRTPEAAESLSNMLGGKAECLELTSANLQYAARRADILINCTALGMTGQPDFASLDFVGCLPKQATVIDAVYNPLETTLLKTSAAMGVHAMSGLWMLVYQGALAFERWTGRMPSEEACAKAFEIVSE